MIATNERLWAELNNLEFRARHLAAQPMSHARRSAVSQACKRIKDLRDLETATKLIACEPAAAVEEPIVAQRHAWQDRADLK